MTDLWWMHAVILGAAFALVAQGMAEELRQWRLRPGSRLFVTGLLWQAFLLLLIIEVWVAFAYYQRTVTTVSVVSLLAFIAVPLAIFTMAVMLNGDAQSLLGVTPEGAGSDDRRESSGEAQQAGSDDGAGVVFDRIRPLFFGALLALIVVNIMHEALLGNADWDSDLLFQGLLAAGAVVGLLIRGRPGDTWLAGLMIAVLGTYILVDYSVVSVA